MNWSFLNECNYRDDEGGCSSDYAERGDDDYYDDSVCMTKHEVCSNPSDIGLSRIILRPFSKPLFLSNLHFKLDRQQLVDIYLQLKSSGLQQ